MPPPTKRALQWLKRLPAIKALLASREMQPPGKQQRHGSSSSSKIRI
jgi:hypothetical protein